MSKKKKQQNFCKKQSPHPPLPTEANSAKAVLFHWRIEMSYKDLRLQQSFLIFFHRKKINPHLLLEKIKIPCACASGFFITVLYSEIE